MLNQKWELSKSEKYAVKWFSENGFNVSLEKQYISKSIFLISKNGISEFFEINTTLNGINLKKYMVQFKINFETLCELKKLKEKYHEKGIAL